MGVVPRQSFLPVGVNALPHLKRYPKQVVDSDKMLPESQIYVMNIMRSKSGINKAEGRHDESPNQVRRCVAASPSDDGGQFSHFAAGSARRPCTTEV